MKKNMLKIPGIFEMGTILIQFVDKFVGRLILQSFGETDDDI